MKCETLILKKYEMGLGLITHMEYNKVHREHRTQGRNFVPKSGGTNFRFVREFGGLDRAPKARESRRQRRRGGGVSRKGAFWCIPDAF